MNKRVWFSCWVFGIVLAGLSFTLSMIAEFEFIYVGIFFIVVHIIGLVKYSKYLEHG